MRVVIRAGAKRDLREIGDWIAGDNPVRAVAFVEELEARAAALAQMPRRGSVYDQSRRGPIHKLTHGACLIYYRVQPSSVKVLAVRDGARRPPRFA